MPGPDRAFCMSGGAAVALLAVKAARSKRIVFDHVMIATAALLTAAGLTSLLLTFAALDQLAKVSLTGIGYPVMLGSCIAGFALYSAAVLKEKIHFVQWGAIMLIVLGVILLNFSVKNTFFSFRKNVQYSFFLLAFRQSLPL